MTKQAANKKRKKYNTDDKIGKSQKCTDKKRPRAKKEQMAVEKIIKRDTIKKREKSEQTEKNRT